MLWVTPTIGAIASLALLLPTGLPSGAYVYRPDGRMVNHMMARQGFAVPLVVPPNVRHVDSIRAASDSARNAGLGLWAVEAFACPPEAFRDGLCGATSIGGEPPPLLRPVSLTREIEDCDPSYPDVCIPPPPPDLDCGDISHRRFRVQGRDPHRFDGDRDGIGCEGR